MKNTLLKILIILSVLLININVKAECIKISVNGSNGGEKGNESMDCGGRNCANTIGLTINGHTFKNTAVYGIRLTIMKDNKAKATRNFWATEKMKQSVNSSKVTRLGKTKKSYGNYYVNGNLYNFTNSDGYNLHQIDYKTSATYAQFVSNKSNGLSNESRLNKYLSKFPSNYDSVKKLVEGSYKIKVEPIFVLHHYGSSVGNYYYAGTAKEILEKRSSHNLSAVTSLNGWHVIRNYLKTMYTVEYGDSNKEWYDHAGKTTGIGYITFDQNSCSYSNLKIVKKESDQTASNNSSRSGNTFKGCATFVIMKKQANGKFKDVTKSVTGSKTVKIGNSCSSGNKDSKEFKKFKSGTYKIKEKSSNGAAVKSVYSRTTVNGKSKNKAGKESNEFKIVGGKTNNVSVTFVNQVTTTVYTIAASVRQLKYIDNWVLNYNNLKENDFYFEKYFAESLASKNSVCKQSESDSLHSYQCYKLCQRKNSKCVDNSDKIGAIPNYVGTVTLVLDKKEGDSWKPVSGTEKTVDFDGSFNTVFWKVTSKGTYRVRQSACKRCGDGKTYIKTQSYKNSAGNKRKGNFRRKLESTSFYVGTYTKGCNQNVCYTGRSPNGNEYYKSNGTYYNAWIINQLPQEQTCQTELEETKKNNYNNANELKTDLINLHQKYSSEDNLLNFTPSDNDVQTIKNKVSCSKTEKKSIVTSCEKTTVGFNEENINNIPLSWYAKSEIAEDLFANDDNLYCYINYNVDFESNEPYKIIRDNVNLNNKSFLWKNPLSDKVGKIKGTLHCEGAISNDNIESYNNNDNVEDKIMNYIDNIELIDDSGDKVQVLKIKKELTKDDYNVKIDSDDSDDSENDENYDDSDVLDGEDVDDGGFDIIGINDDNIEDDYTDSLEENDRDIAENIIVGNYLIFTRSFTYNLIYDKLYYADYFSGTAFETASSSSLYQLGWGVPVAMNKPNGTIKFKYNFNDDSVIEKFYKSIFSNIDNGIVSSCTYHNQSNSFGVRFIDINNPFPGIKANSRKTGKNWNTCYNTILNRVGNPSNLSYCDYTGNCSDQDKDSAKNVYCLYGDPNCDGKFDRYESTYTNYVSKKLADVNGDNVVDAFDWMLVNRWYKYNIANERIDLLKVCSDYDTEYMKYHGNTEDILISSVIKDINKSSSSNDAEYSFTLSSKDLQNIRNYAKDSLTNNKLSYLNVDTMNCNAKGECVSNFITDLITNSNNLTLTQKSGRCFESSNMSSSTAKNINGVEEIVYTRKYCK